MRNLEDVPLQPIFVVVPLRCLNNLINCVVVDIRHKECACLSLSLKKSCLKDDAVFAVKESLVLQQIKAFLALSPPAIDGSAAADGVIPATAPSTAMAQQTAQDFTRRQQRLAHKLNERLGYLGVYYKRDPDCFARSMLPDEREAFLRSLKEAYREIIVTYFLDDPRNNDRLDGFVNTVFFADLSVAKVVEIHMDLIDESSKQLKLEGRSDEVLLDYRLTLIDRLAHLCEMYRRSVPREIPED
jgi:circadian clock protein KaiA